jgi:hypothetical protein
MLVTLAEMETLATLILQTRKLAIRRTQVLRRGILAVAKAATPEHPHCGL